jgi:hypothetical protein
MNDHGIIQQVTAIPQFMRPSDTTIFYFLHVICMEI